MIASAPWARARSSFDAPPAVAITVAPASLANLKCGAPDSAGHSVDEHRLASLEPCPRDEHVPGRAERDLYRGPVRCRQVSADRQQVVGLHGDEFRTCARTVDSQHPPMVAAILVPTPAVFAEPAGLILGIITRCPTERLPPYRWGGVRRGPPPPSQGCAETTGAASIHPYEGRRQNAERRRPPRARRPGQSAARGRVPSRTQARPRPRKLESGQPASALPTLHAGFRRSQRGCEDRPLGGRCSLSTHPSTKARKEFRTRLLAPRDTRDKRFLKARGNQEKQRSSDSQLAPSH